VKERLQKILSRAGVASRRAAERLILEKRVTVDGRMSMSWARAPTAWKTSASTAYG